MHFLIAVLSLTGAVSALNIPASKPQQIFLSPWVVQDIAGYDNIDKGDESAAFAHVNSNEKLVTNNLDEEISNLTSYFRVRDDTFETTAPEATVWQGMPSSQWDDWHRDVVVKAWNNAIKIAEQAADSLNELVPGGVHFQLFDPAASLPVCQILDEDVRTLEDKAYRQYMLCYRTFLAANHFAYGQYFAADPENIEQIAKNFRTIANQTNNITAEEREGQLLYMTWGPTITEIDKKVNECAKGSTGWPQAMVIGASQVAELASSLPANAWVMHFCPAFFDVNELGRMETQVQGSTFSLDKLDSTTRCILHEFTHLPWTLNTNANETPTDERGYLWIVSLSANWYYAQQQPYTNSFSAANADSYAWMAIYNYFNSLDKCANILYSGPNSIPGSCNADVWPQSEPKIIKTTWPSWPTKGST